MRPTADRVKESIFDVLGGPWSDLRILDLFAGSGALGIEALSRGARQAVFVEADRAALAVLQRNLRACELAERARVVRTEVLRWLARSRKGMAFDVIFADPPYERGLAARCLLQVASGGWLTPGGRLILEHSRRESLPARQGGLSLLEQRSYGDTRISILGYEHGA